MSNLRPGAALRLVLGPVLAVMLFGATTAQAQTIYSAFPNPTGSPITIGPLTVQPGEIAIVGSSFGTVPSGVNDSISPNGVFLNGQKLNTTAWNSQLIVSVLPVGIPQASYLLKVQKGLSQFAMFEVFMDIESGGIGSPGATGATGVAGAAGATGATGAAGGGGASGSTGSVGATGATGASGSNGAVGATGGSGAVGAAGATGASGANGAVGSTGASGANGAAGATGVTGSNGAAGVTGASGSNGAAGVTGSNGAAGVTGSNGAAGATGASGSNGAVGATGASGAASVVPGPPGSPGSTGAPGATGPTGTGGGATVYSQSQGTPASTTPRNDAGSAVSTSWNATVHYVSLSTSCVATDTATCNVDTAGTATSLSSATFTFGSATGTNQSYTLALLKNAATVLGSCSIAASDTTPTCTVTGPFVLIASDTLQFRVTRAGTSSLTATATTAAALTIPVASVPASESLLSDAHIVTGTATFNASTTVDVVLTGPAQFPSNNYVCQLNSIAAAPAVNHWGVINRAAGGFTIVSSNSNSESLAYTCIGK